MDQKGQGWPRLWGSVAWNHPRADSGLLVLEGERETGIHLWVGGSEDSKMSAQYLFFLTHKTLILFKFCFVFCPSFFLLPAAYMCWLELQQPCWTLR